jgi:hypothetical protein
MVMRNVLMVGLVCLALAPAMLAAASPEEAKSAQPAVKPKVKPKHQDKVKTPTHAVAAYKRPSVPVPMPASDQAIEQNQKVVAEQVHTGRMICELGNSVNVAADTQNPGHFHVQLNKFTYHMSPVVSATGAIRLEDSQAGAMWLQLSNKSMLMNSKLGQRMADECQSPDQMAVAEAMKLAPPVSLLEGLNTGAGLAKK